MFLFFKFKWFFTTFLTENLLRIHISCDQSVDHSDRRHYFDYALTMPILILFAHQWQPHSTEAPNTKLILHLIKKFRDKKNHINSSVQNISLYYAGFILHLSLCFTFQFSVKFQFDQRKNSKIHFFNVQIKYFTFPTTTNLCENQRFLRCWSCHVLNKTDRS